MRLIFKLIVAVLILDFVAGIVMLLLRLFSKPKPEHRYYFRSFRDGEKHGYYMDDSKNNHILYAVKAGEENKCAVYKFTNTRSHRTVKHTISGLGNNDKAPNFTNVSFLFDNTDVWEYLSKRGIDLQTTMVDDGLTMYKIKKNSNPVAFAKKRRDENNPNSYVYTLRTCEDSLDMFFLALFALARTEKNGIQRKQNVKIKKVKKGDDSQ